MTDPPQTRRRGPQKRAKETKQHLLDAALEMFSTVGFEGTTAAAIEEVAGVQRGLLAYHFGGKDEIWRRAADRAFERFEASTREMFAAEVSVRCVPLDALIAAFIRSTAQQSDWLNLIVREAKIESGRRDYIAEKHTSRFTGMISALTARPPSVHDFYILTGAMIFAYIAPAGARRNWNIDPSSEAFVAAHIDAIIDLFHHGWPATP